jgi:hypothetical protein
MKTLRYLGFCLAWLGCTAATLPAPALRAVPSAARTSVRQWLARYHYFTDTEIPALLAWLQDWGPFTQPPPTLLPEQPQAAPASAWTAAP